ncbi:hypothetical protein LXL04_023320 [Taraxacum kok-saghyz]
MEEIPDLKLEHNTKKLRQAYFKANYKKRRTMGMMGPMNYEGVDDDYGDNEDEGDMSIMEDIPKKGRGKRGIALFKKKREREEYRVEFDENNIPLTKEFMSWFGMLVQHRIPIHIDMCNIDKELFKNLWLETKMTWNIETDAPEEFMRKKAVKIGTNFRSRLVTDYVIINKSPCEKYTFIEPADWNTFFKQKTNNEFLLKSEKAKKSNSNKKFIPRLGRGGWKGIEKKKDIIWPQPEEKYEFLKNIKNHRSKMYLLGCSIQNKETKLYELPPSAIEDFKILDQEEKSMIADGSYDLNKEDPLIRLLGPEHGGRSHTVCEIIGSTKVHGGLIKNVNHSTCSVNTKPSYHDSSCGSGGPCNDYPPIQTMTACELLIKVADSQVKVASGTAWPTSGAIIHGKSLEEGCVKVQVDKIIESYGDLPVHAVTKTDEVETVKDIYHAVVQWPRYALKLANKETPSKSTRMDSSQSSPQRDTATNKETPNKSTRIDSSHSSPQRDTTTNKETPSKSTRMDSSHSSPQKHSATTSFYYPPFVDNQIPIHPFNGTSLSILRKKGPKYSKILDLLSGLYGDDFSISTYSPQGLYPDRVQFAVPYSEILQPLLNDLLDVSIIRWFAMYFYGLTNNSNCVFFDPEVIKDSNVQTNPVGVIKHIKEIFLHHKKNKIFSCTIYKGETKIAYILDSLLRPSNNDNYPLISIFDNTC